MSLVSRQLFIGGMTCANCQNRIMQKLENTAGIKKVMVSYSKGIADITYDTDLISLKDIVTVIENLGYEVLPENQVEQKNIVEIFCFLIIIIALFVLLQRSGVLNLLVPGQLAEAGMGYGMLFLVGLFTSVHCIAMCGGINLSQCIPKNSRLDDGSRWSTFLPSVLYNLGRVISYTVIGFLLGFLGMLIGGDSEVGISLFIQGILKIIAGIFMVIMGINMLGIFPWMRKFSLHMPGFLAEKISGQKGKSRQPLFIGLLNGLMPCGPLQAMQIVALASGNPFTGAFAMFFFSLGTVPLMLGLGSIVSALGKRFAQKVMNVGAVLIVVLGLAMLSQGGSLSGLLPSGNLLGSSGSDSVSSDEVEVVDNTQIVTSTLASGSYPNITVQAGIPVKWIINAPEGSINGCNYKLVIRDYGIEYTFQQGENVIEFTPVETGTVQYTCWMGMIRGNIFVTEGGTSDTSDQNVSDPTDQMNSDITESNESDVPVPAGYTIPSQDMAIAEKSKDSEGNIAQNVTITLTEKGFDPAVIVLEKNIATTWIIQEELQSIEADHSLLAPYYSTKLPLASGENTFYLYPTESFEVSTDDHAFYAYVKVVDDINNIDSAAIQEEVSQFETLIYPEVIFESSGTGGSCCN